MLDSPSEGTMSGAALSGEFAFPPIRRVTFGAGCVQQLPADLDEAGVARVELVTSGSLATDTDLVSRLEGLIGERLVGVFAQPRQHTPRATVAALAERVRADGADAVVSFGGGSVCDLAKGARLMVSEGIDADGLDGYVVRFEAGEVVTPQLQGDVLPHWTLPTTLSGAEWTPTIGIVDPERGVKDLFKDDRLGVRHALLDAELTLATPTELWAASGIRAIDHCVELWYSTLAQPFTTTLCRNALLRLVEYLPASVEDPEDLDARTQCEIACWESAFGVVNSRPGLSHAIGLQLGARYGVMHGITSCLTLPAAMEFNREAATPELAEVGRILGVADADDEAAAAAAPAALRRFISSLGLPTRLAEVGIGSDQYEEIADVVLPSYVLESNPRPVTDAAEIVDVLRKAG